jgi:hypothetical protein
MPGGTLKPLRSLKRVEMDIRPRLLDLFCGAGGAAMGYHRAGFEVVGVDLNPPPHYPFEFVRADALTFPLEGFDAYHASPPCQFASELTPPEWKGRHLNLISPVRLRLMATGRPYIIENWSGRTCGVRYIWQILTLAMPINDRSEQIWLRRRVGN